ncbi:hypothetical protein LABOLPEG_00021 [Pseudomonas phage phi 21A]|nr:hypothetical protein LABOLPEG_00021 [Pseudomonas phage phi 21A]
MLKSVRNFDLVDFLVTLAGNLQARRVNRLKRREAALKATIEFATQALVATERERVDAAVRCDRIGY